MPFYRTADGTELFYRDWGTGRPVVFTSSWGMSSQMWQYQMVALVDRGFRCISYDRRGHGRSDDPGRGYDADVLADDLAALIEHLDLPELTLVGHSMGCTEIVRYLTRHGEDRVTGVALVSPTLPFLLKTDDNPAGIDPAVSEAVRSGWRADFPRWLADSAPAFFGAGLPGCEVSQALQDWGIGDMTQTSLQAVIECNRVLVETDFRAEMREISLPTLIVHGDTDASAPVELTGARCAQLISHSRFVIYENAPHGLFVTHCDQLNKDLLGFLEG